MLQNYLESVLDPPVILPDMGEDQYHCHSTQQKHLMTTGLSCFG